MRQSFKNALGATALIGLSLYLWRIAYEFGDWAIITLFPLAAFICLGSWTLALAPWKARLKITLRDDSRFSRFLTGKMRAGLLAFAFTFIGVTLLAWQALQASPLKAGIMLALVFIAGSIFSVGERFFERHFHQPFARAISVSAATWLVALPFFFIIAYVVWAWEQLPGPLLDASFAEAIQIGINELPNRRGWLAEILAIPFAYESVRIWVAVQLKDYPLIGVLFSMDAALFSFVLARTGIVVTQVLQSQNHGGTE